MKKWVIGIMIFMSVFFIVGISKASAKNYDINDVNLNNIGDLQYYSSNYSIALSRLPYNGGNKLMIVFWNSNIGRLEINTDNQSYQNEICLEQGACFSRFDSNAAGSSSPRYKAYYTSTDNGNSWTLGYANGYSTDLVNNGYILKTTVDLYGYSSSTKDTLYFHSGYEYVSEIPVEQLPHLVYNISVDTNGDMYLDYYYDTLNTSGRELITCIRYVVPANEGVSCNRYYELNHIYKFGPIYPSNTYTIEIQDFATTKVLYSITINIQEYIDSLPEIEKTDIIAEYTYYNQDYLTDSPKALTNLLNVLNAPIQVITEIVLYIWNSLNVYIKLFLIAMFSALMFSAIIRYIK